MEQVNYSEEIRNIILFYNDRKRFPFCFTNDEYEHKLYKDMINIINYYTSNKDVYDPIGDIRMIYYNYNFDNEFNSHYNDIVNFLEYGIILEDFENYKELEYLTNFINHIQENRYYLDINKYVNIENLPLWKWKKNNINDRIDKLYYFCQYRKRLPFIYTFDIEEYNLANFCNIIYYYYIYEKIDLATFDELYRIKYFNFKNYKMCGHSFLKRYCKEFNVYNYNHDKNSFEYNFNHFFKFYRDNDRPPLMNEQEYIYSYNIKKLYNEVKLGELQINVMNEFDGWNWSFTVEITDELSTEKPIFIDDNINLINNMIKTNYNVYIRKDYNYSNNLKRTHYTISSCKSYIHKHRVSKVKCNMRLKLIREFENSH